MTPLPEEALAKGEAGEKVLDAYFSGWYDIEPATQEQQREGIDRVFTFEDGVAAHLVEYKTDYTAWSTGNLFIETVSVKQEGKPDKLGWAYTSKADRFIFYVPQARQIYMLDAYILRLVMPIWESRYPKAETDPSLNDGYVSVGLLVPVGDMRVVALSRRIPDEVTA